MQAVLAGLGYHRGQRLALLSDNNAESWCLNVAALLLGMSTTWLHPKGSLDDQLFQIVDADADIIAIDAVGHAKRGRELAEKLPPHVRVATLGAGDFGADLVAAAHGVGSATAVDLAHGDDIALLHYTGGTTGRSKGAVRTHRETHAFYSVGILADCELPATPHYLGVAPHSHAAGSFILPVWSRGGTVRCVRGFAPDRVLELIASERVNCTFIVPTMVYALLDAPRLGSTDLSAMELILYGAAPMSPTRLVEGLERIGPVFSQMYGQTEVYPVTILKKADHDAKHPELFASCGVPMSIAQVRLLDDNGREVGIDEPGEICVRSPAAMTSYWKQPELSAETLAGGWVHTADIAKRDERGYLYIVDRKKDMIISGGFNVYPREVEDVLTAHELVAMAAVIGTPDPKWGEAVTAIVVLKPGATPDAAALIEHVKRAKGSSLAPEARRVCRVTADDAARQDRQEGTARDVLGPASRGKSASDASAPRRADP